jgi:hypothetical protein
VDMKNIRAIEGWIVINNASEVRSFMGLVGYYRIFNEYFSNIAHLITSLQKKGLTFEWTSDCEKCFQHLKSLLTSEPILRIVDPNEDFFVYYTDACMEGMGGFLIQNEHVICYKSRNLKEHERHYATHDLELESIAHALNMWRHYLMGKRFELRVDHSGLKYLFGKPTLIARKNRWLDFLSEYGFDINNIKGKENKVIDALSGRVHEMHTTSISMYKSYLKDKILEASKLDQHYMETKEKLQEGNNQQKIQDYELREDGILMYKGRPYVPNFLRDENIVLREMHNVPYVGHLSYYKTSAIVKSQYFSLGMKKEVVEYISRCLECQKFEVEHRHPTGLLQPLPIPE